MKAIIESMRAPTEIQRRKKKASRRWRPKLDLDGNVSQYHSRMNNKLSQYSGNILQELENIIRNSASISGVASAKSSENVRPEKFSGTQKSYKMKTRI